MQVYIVVRFEECYLVYVHRFVKIAVLLFLVCEEIPSNYVVPTRI